LHCALHSSTYFQGIKFNFSRTTLPSQATFAECKHVAGLAFKSGAVFLRTFVRLNSNTNDVLVEQVELTYEIPLYKEVCQCFSTFLLQWNLPQMFALLMEPYVNIQVSILDRAGFN